MLKEFGRNLNSDRRFHFHTVNRYGSPKNRIKYEYYNPRVGQKHVSQNELLQDILDDFIQIGNRIIKVISLIYLYYQLQ